MVFAAWSPATVFDLSGRPRELANKMLIRFTSVTAAGALHTSRFS